MKGLAIISGGQTGVDIAALRAARALGLKTGGWAPPRFMTSKGPKEKLLRDHYGLKAIDFSGSWPAAYARRSMRNVDESDASVVIRTHASTGTDKTLGYCISGKWQKPKEEPVVAGEVVSTYRPVFVVTTLTVPNAKLSKFVKRYETINVAGHRGDAAWELEVQRFLEKVFSSKGGLN